MTTRPQKKSRANLRRMPGSIAALLVYLTRRELKESTIEMPMMKRKVGKTRSVGVKPFHSE